MVNYQTLSTGPRHSSDVELFGPGWRDPLATATRELSWLLTRGYQETSAIKLVGDRHNLNARQRKGVCRCACADAALADRLERRVRPRDLEGREVAIDGLNCLITLETALGGGVVLRGRDGCLRDLASVHGGFDHGPLTRQAITSMGELLKRARARTVIWYLDRPVSGSGRLRGLLAEEWSWQVELVADPDRVLSSTDAVVATSDSMILDRCGNWANLVGEIITSFSEHVWLLDLGQ